MPLFCMALFIQTTLAITVLSAGLLSVFMFSKGPILYHRRLLALHLLSISVWAFATLSILRFEPTWAVELAFASAAVMTASKFYFIIDFPEKATPYCSFLRYVPLAGAIFIFCLSFVDQALIASFFVVDNSYVLIENGVYGGIYMLIVSGLVIYPVIDLYRKLRSGRYVERVAEQIKFLLIGVSFFLVVGLATNSILPVVFEIYYFNGLGPSFALILAGLILYIIRRHHFLGLSLVIQRGFIYTILLLGIGGVYLSVLFIFDVITHQITPIHPIVSGLITTIIGIFSIPRLDAWLRKKTDPFFFKDRYEYSEVLQGLSETLNRSVEIIQIKTATKQALQKTLKAGAVKLDLYAEEPTDTTKETAMATGADGSLTVPLVSNGRQLGTLHLQPKRSGDPYTSRDKQLLETTSNHLALACERALLYHQLQRYSKELEAKVTQRTAELAEAYRMQQATISNIAHGLQTPLTVIEDELGNLRKNNLASEHVLLLERSLTSISTFIHDLLRLARLESKVDTLTLETCNLSDLLRDVASYVTLLAADKQVTVTTQTADDVYVTADPKRIEEMLTVLLSNALKYMNPEGQRSIALTLRATDTVATISVTDSGVGIPAHALPRIYDRFYRVKEGVLRDVPGSGLGLAIAKAIVEKHQGTISAASTVGVGTTFTVTLPRKR